MSALPTEGGYAGPWDHFIDEMKRLDLLLLRELLIHQRGHPSDPIDHLRGLVLSGEEISALLTGSRPEKQDDEARFDAEEQRISSAIQSLEARISSRLSMAALADARPPLPLLAQLFQLEPLEEQCLLICLAPEVDRKYEKVFAFLQDDVTLKKPSVDLALNLLCPERGQRLECRAIFDPQAPLVRHRLIQVLGDSSSSDSPLISRTLKLDDRIAGFLLGGGGIDRCLGSMARLVWAPSDVRPLTGLETPRQRMEDLFRAVLSRSPDKQRSVFFHLRGNYGSGRRGLAEGLCQDLGLPLLMADARVLATRSQDLEECVQRLAREAVLQPCAIALENFDALLSDERQPGNVRLLSEAFKTYARLVFLLGSRAWQPGEILDQQIFVQLECPIPVGTVRKRIWQQQLNGQGRTLQENELSELAGKFRLTAGQIRDAVKAANDDRLWKGGKADEMTMDDLQAACRSQSNHNLAALARKIEPLYQWKDIVLPADAKKQLRELTAQARYRQRVLNDWGFSEKLSLGRGVNALFAGPSGTGKTMAAEIIANDLGLDLYKVDLSGIVSKYIGETEKNLDRVFSGAENSNSILFFDEADALFGKRSQVKDAHDRYANIEIAYLLQKMEEYDGIVILATNMRRNMDDAFVRRLRFIVEFPLPNQQQREQIWGRVFPAQAPLASDADFPFLARRLALSGGNIKNISLRAAYLAAEQGRDIDMKALILASRRELQKIGKLFQGSDFGPYAKYLEEDAASEVRKS